MSKRQVLLSLIGMAVVVCLAAPSAAQAANYPWSSTSSNYTQGGENTATIDGEGGCKVTAVYKIVTVTPQGEMKVRIDPSEYTVEDGKNHPVVRFRKGLSRGIKIVVEGDTPNKPKSGNSHTFKMNLKKV